MLINITLVHKINLLRRELEVTLKTIFIWDFSIFYNIFLFGRD